MSITRNKQSNLSTLGLTVLTRQLCHQLAISPTHHSADLQNVIVMQSKRTQCLKFCIKQLSMRLRIMTMILASNQMAFNIKIKMIFCVNQNMSKYAASAKVTYISSSHSRNIHSFPSTFVGSISFHQQITIFRFTYLSHISQPTIRCSKFCMNK